MNTHSSKRSVGLVVAGVVLVAAAFGSGAWIGADVVGRMYGSHALPRATASANSLHRKLVLLDKGDASALREQIEMELDSELIAVCVLSKERSGTPEETSASARSVLQRIAAYRSEKPPSHPAAYGALDPTVRRTLQDCLDEARRAPGK